MAASLTKFEDVCELLEKLYTNRKNRTLADSILFNFIDDFRTKVAQTPGTNKDSNFFPILRLLLPKLDRQRPAYDLKEEKLGKLYVKVLSLHRQSRDAQKLLSFREARGSHHGSDFASIVFSVLQTRVSSTGDLTVGGVNEYLDRVANAEAGSKAQTNYEVFTDIVCKTTPLQHKWWIRIILKNMKLEMGDKRILACFHPDAPEQYELCQDILKICSELDQGDSRPPELGIQLFSAVSPMLSERLDVTKIGSLPANTSYQIENKFDGERFQIHMRDGVFAYFSRRGHSYTEQYGATHDSAGMLTPRLRDCFDPSVTSFILDGEMMGWHKEKMCYSSKGMSFDVKKITPSSKFAPCFCAFDVLLHDGRALVGEAEGALPLWRRVRLLDALFAEVPGALVRSRREVVKDGEEILTALNKAIESEQEGIIVKDVNSFYVANKRNAGWYKVKPEYTEGVMVDLDLVVIGADYAHNSICSGIARSFMLGLAVKPQEPASETCWVSLGRASSGLTHEQREQLCSELARHWKPLARVPPSSCLRFANEKPDVWINPRDSVVLQVKASELIRTTQYAAGYTLRFPRILKVRRDKPVEDAMTLEEMEKLVQGRSVEKLTARQVCPSELKADLPVRKRKSKPLELASAFRPADTALSPESAAAEGTVKVQRVGALDGRKVAVLSGDEVSGKQELEKLVASHGGVPVQNIGSDTWLCVAGKRTQRVVNALANYDVATADWLRRIEAGGTLNHPGPLDFLSTSRATKAKLARSFDRYGDSYTEEIDEDMMRTLIDKMDEVDRVHLTTDEKLRLDEELHDGPSPFSCLRGCHVYVDADSRRLRLLAEGLGARVSDEETAELTHVIWDDKVKDCSEFAMASDAVVVTEGWLQKCIECKQKVDESPYIV